MSDVKDIVLPASLVDLEDEASSVKLYGFHVGKAWEEVNEDDMRCRIDELSSFDVEACQEEYDEELSFIISFQLLRCICFGFSIVNIKYQSNN